MFYIEDNNGDSGDDDVFVIEKESDEYASYEGILLQDRHYCDDNEDEIPMAVESKDIQYIDIYKPVHFTQFCLRFKSMQIPCKKKSELLIVR